MAAAGPQGRGGDYGFVPVLVAAAARNGVSGYLSTGTNRWPAVHRADAARLFRLALEKAPAGSALHGVGEQGVRVGRIADRIASHPTLLEDLVDAGYCTPEAVARTESVWSPDLTGA